MEFPVPRRPVRAGRAVRAAALALILALPGLGCGAAGAASVSAGFGEGDVFYQIFVRSFADSDGDRIGDLKGIEERLPYLADLGVTSIVLTPIVESRFYHNYFASRFDGIDPAYGDLESFRRLARAAHARHMRIILDEEIQYVDAEHPWWSDSAGRPESRYGDYVLYNGPGNTQPESGFLDDAPALTYDGQALRLAVVNLHSTGVRRYFDGLFAWWLAQGVDGFRIDHMMDDLDDKGRLTNLVAGFWAPLIAHLRTTRPGLVIVAEQADWKFGDDLLRRGDVDLVYAFPLREAIVSLDPDGIRRAITETWHRTPAGRGQLVFIENHDTNRFASEVDGDPARERLGAALCVLLKGAPLIYYGQEIGMRGKRVPAGTSDGNDIPDREAFRWTRTLEGRGTATWYRGPAAWWTERYSHDDDGVSVEEQRRDPGSLLSFYRRLLRLRRNHPELRAGDQELVDLGQPGVIGVRRSTARSVVLLLFNVSSATVMVQLPEYVWNERRDRVNPRDLLTQAKPAALASGGFSVTLAPYGVQVLGLR
jgi:alpha-amylase